MSSDKPFHYSRFDFYLRAFFILGLILCAGLLIVSQARLTRTYEKERALLYKDAVSKQSGLRVAVSGFEGAKETAPVRGEIGRLDLNGGNYAPFNKERFQAQLAGFLKVDQSGWYSLELSSDDSAVLYLDGFKVLDNSGTHSFQSLKKKQFLVAGFYKLKIEYTNYKGASGLKVSLGKKGEERKILDSENLFLEKSVPAPAFDPYPILSSQKTVSQEFLRLYRLQAGSAVAAFVFLCLFLFWKKIKEVFFNWQGGAAIAIFLLALGVRWLHYAGNLYQRIMGIVAQGDYLYFLTLPVQFATDGEFISLNCGNLPVLIPLLGTFYKYFGFYPGIHYYSLLMLVLGAAVSVLPWLLVRRFPYGWIGLAGSLFLALNPVLVQTTRPFVSTEVLGFFVFSWAVYFCVKALLDSSKSYYFFAGLFLFLMPLTRTVFIPLSAAMVLGLLIVSRQRLRAGLSAAVFFLAVLGYDFLVRNYLLGKGIETPSYFFHFIKDAVGNSVVNRSAEMPAGSLAMLLWLPQYLGVYLKSIFSKLILPVSGFVWANILFTVIIAGSFAKLIKDVPRVALFLLGVFCVYLFEIASYYYQVRLTYPFYFLIAVCFVAAAAQIKQAWFKRLLGWGLVVLAVLNLFHYPPVLNQVLARGAENKTFRRWIQKAAPPKSILLADIKSDPWKLLSQTGLPVIYNSPDSPSFVVTREVIPVNRLTIFELQVKNPKPGVSRRFYALDALKEKGYRYLVVSGNYAAHLKEKFSEEYRLTKLADYPEEPSKGIWELTPARNTFQEGWENADYSFKDSFDRFLVSWKNEYELL